MRNKLLLIVGLFSISLQVLSAQATEENVTSTIYAFFDAMRAADSTTVRSFFHPDARLQTVAVSNDGEVSLHDGNIDRFILSVGSNPQGSLDEKLSHFRVEIDGPLATAWTGYMFYYNSVLSHCGNNAFQLVRLGEEWKITQIIDTRRSQGCVDSLDPETKLEPFLDQWHHAASVADFEAFFGAIAENGVYIGTDVSERWTKSEFATWAAPWFETDSAWDFSVVSRNSAFSETGLMAWWDEILETQMGIARGSGIAKWTESGWKIQHYHLALPVPNEKLDAFMQLMQEGQNRD